MLVWEITCNFLLISQQLLEMQNEWSLEPKTWLIFYIWCFAVASQLQLSKHVRAGEYTEMKAASENTDWRLNMVPLMANTK